jgi:hypothetical protein
MKIDELGGHLVDYADLHKPLSNVYTDADKTVFGGQGVGCLASAAIRGK